VRCGLKVKAVLMEEGKSEITKMTGKDSDLIPKENRFTSGIFLVSLLMMVCWFPLVVLHLFFTQLPLIRIRFTGGTAHVLLLSAGFLLLLYVFSGFSLFPLIILMILAPGVLAGELLARQVPLKKFIIFYTLSLIIFSFISGGLTPTEDGIFSAGGAGEGSMEEPAPTVEFLAALFKEMDEEQIKKLLAFSSRIYPAEAVSLTIIAALLNVICLRRFKYYAVVPMDRNWRFHSLKIPDYFLFVFLLFGLLLLTVKTAAWSTLALNGLIVAVFIYILQGLAVLMYYLNWHNTDLVIRILIYLAVIIFSLWVLLAFIGLFDTWFNFRKHKLVDGKT